MPRSEENRHVVEGHEDVAANLSTLYSYLSGTPEEKKFAIGIINRGRNFVLWRSGEEWLSGPSRFVGYQKNDMRHESTVFGAHGGRTDQVLDRLIGNRISTGDAGYDECETLHLEFCTRTNSKQSNHERSYWLLNYDNLEYTYLYQEGRSIQSLSTRYERSFEARAICLREYGYRCCICNFDFEETYGDLGRHFIHVHHLTPLASIREEYELDPINDLRPVCPNCHSMVHRRATMATIGELQRLIRSSKKSVV